MEKSNVDELNISFGKKPLCIFHMIYNFTIAITRIHFANCEAIIQTLLLCAYFFKHLSLSMLISFMLIKKECSLLTLTIFTGGGGVEPPTKSPK